MTPQEPTWTEDEIEMMECLTHERRCETPNECRHQSFIVHAFYRAKEELAKAKADLRYEQMESYSENQAKKQVMSELASVKARLVLAMEVVKEAKYVLEESGEPQREGGYCILTDAAWKKILSAVDSLDAFDAAQEK